jgi:hypothetical protein
MGCLEGIEDSRLFFYRDRRIGAQGVQQNHGCSQNDYIRSTISFIILLLYRIILSVSSSLLDHYSMLLYYYYLLLLLLSLLLLL